MIVKNESKVIVRCLESLIDLIDYWVIVDTGSSDGTQDIIRNFLRDIPGELIERPWVDFGHNRTEALEYARGKADYLLTIDADEVLDRGPDFRLPVLTADSYLLEFSSGALSYYKCQLVRNTLSWGFKGALHEFIFCDEASSQEILSNLKVIRYLDGARSSDPQKFQKDALVLENALLDEPHNERHVFYLAQSYRDGGEIDRAIENYRKRLGMGGWHEECWYSMYQIAVLKHQRGDPWPEVQDAYLQAYQFRPNRTEPLHKLVAHYFATRQYHLAYLYGRQAMAIPYPDQDLLFVERPVYDYALAIDYAATCYWVGDHTGAIGVNNALLMNPALPPQLYSRVLENRRFSLDARYTKNDVPSERRNRIKVCVRFFNPGCFLDNCVESLLNQDYGNFEVVFYDDASSDGSHLKIPTDDSRFNLIRNQRQRGALWNAHHFLTEHCSPDDIVVFLDGDDWLACDHALSRINELYERYGCWVLYGQYRFSSTGRYGSSMPFADPQSFARHREVWYVGHIRTFRAGVYHAIADYDPVYDCMRGPDGEWYRTTEDRAIMYPVMELAGFDRVCFNDEVFYVYNDENPLNDFRCNAEQQEIDAAHICARAPFPRIDRDFFGSRSEAEPPPPELVEA